MGGEPTNLVDAVDDEGRGQQEHSQNPPKRYENQRIFHPVLRGGRVQLALRAFAMFSNQRSRGQGGGKGGSRGGRGAGGGG